MIYKIKRFSKSRILSTSSSPGFQRNRKYDMDLGRLGKMKTSQSELSNLRELNKELRNLGKDLNRGVKDD